MAEPNPIWGLHVAPGAITGALVERTRDGEFRVVDTLRAAAPTTTEALVDVTLDVLRRDNVAGRPAFVATHDGEMTIAVGWIPREQLQLNADEIFGELHEFVPFEPGEGHLIYRPYGAPEERRYLLAGIDVDAYRSVESLAGRLDVRLHGIGLATPATRRGSTALGLAGPGMVVVDVQADRTTVLALDAGGSRRSLLLSGLEQIAGDAGKPTAAALARDLLRIAAYERARRARRLDQDDDQDHADEIGSAELALVGANAERAREILAPHLKEHLALPDHRVALDADARPVEVPATTGAGAAAPELAPAIGAALEAFAPTDQRLAIRHVPPDVPAYRDGGRGSGGVKRLVAAVLLLGIGAAIASNLVADDPPVVAETVTSGGVAPPDVVPSGSGTETETETGSTVEESTGTEPPPAQTALPAPTLGERAPDGMRLTFPAQARPVRIHRRPVSSADGPEADDQPEWTRLATLAAGVAEFHDPVGPGTGTYAWRLEDSRGPGPELQADVVIPIDVELLEGDTREVTFRLARRSADRTIERELTVGASERLVVTYAERGTDARPGTAFRLDAGAVTRLEIVTKPVEREISVPTFEPDGRVRRDADGNAVLQPRVVRETEDVLEVDVTSPEGSLRTWVREMTDG